MKKRAQYTLEFKLEAVRLVKSGSKIGRGVGDASRGAAEPSQLGQAGPGRLEASQTRH
jgi:transposase-like protein